MREATISAELRVSTLAELTFFGVRYVIPVVRDRPATLLAIQESASR